MVTEAPKRASGMTPEEVLAWHREDDEAQKRIRDAITLGLAADGVDLSPKKRKKIRQLVLAALDALPYGSGSQPLTDADVEFAKAFAETLAGDMDKGRER
jgi:hypothetical protein